jgi:protein-tyrosine phosphatase
LFNSILTVCTGNICRSPFAEYILRHQLEQTVNWQGKVSSAGISALVRQPADETIVELMLERGIVVDSHRAKQLTQQHLRLADLVLVMEKHHLAAVLELDPTARGKTFLLGHWSNTQIPDPYQRGAQAYAKTLQLIEDGLKTWLKKIVPPDQVEKPGCNIDL